MTSLLVQSKIPFCIENTSKDFRFYTVVLDSLFPIVISVADRTSNYPELALHAHSRIQFTFSPVNYLSCQG